MGCMSQLPIGDIREVASADMEPACHAWVAEERHHIEINWTLDIEQ